MNQPEAQPELVTLTTRITNSSNLPMYHVNAIDLRYSSDEFYFTFGVASPPDASNIETGYIDAQPIVRFAISRDTMEQFLNVMVSQFEQQTTLLKGIDHSDEVISKEEVNGNE